MSLSLRQRVFVLLIAINVAVVGGEVWFLARSLAQSSAANAERHARDLISVLRGQIRPESGVNVVHILRWPQWGRLGDALIADRRIETSPTGRLSPQGVALNPKGSSHRPADFDYQSIYGAIRLAVTGGQPVEGVAGGRVIPIDHEDGVWGGLWYRFEPEVDMGALLTRYFLPIFVVSTLLLSLVTFAVLQRFVLEPVEQLAAASRRLAAGDLDVRLGEPPRRDELAELVRAFNAMTVEVRGAEEKLAREVREATARARQAEAAAMTQRRLAATGELAAGIAHEINNPLGGLQNAVEALARPELSDAKRTQYLELLRGGLERIRATVEKLLRFTPRRSREARLQRVSPARAVLDALALVRHRAGEEGVALEVELGGRRAALPADGTWPEALSGALDALAPIEAEEGELGQAVLNLLVNALDALQALPQGTPPAGRRVVVGLETLGPAGAEGELVVSVTDSGPGIPPEDLDRVRDLFYTTKDVGKGSGLGLAMVHNVAEAHGGRLVLENVAGGGLRAALVLPRAPRPFGSRDTREGRGSGV